MDEAFDGQGATIGWAMSLGWAQGVVSGGQPQGQPILSFNIHIHYLYNIHIMHMAHAQSAPMTPSSVRPDWARGQSGRRRGIGGGALRLTSEPSLGPAMTSLYPAQDQPMPSSNTHSRLSRFSRFSQLSRFSRLFTVFTVFLVVAVITVLWFSRSSRFSWFSRFSRFSQFMGPRARMCEAYV